MSFRIDTTTVQPLEHTYKIKCQHLIKGKKKPTVSSVSLAKCLLIQLSHRTSIDTLFVSNDIFCFFNEDGNDHDETQLYSEHLLVYYYVRRYFYILCTRSLLTRLRSYGAGRARSMHREKLIFKTLGNTFSSLIVSIHSQTPLQKYNGNTQLL